MSTSFVSTRPAPSITPMPPAVQMPRSAASLPPRSKQKLATMIEHAEQLRDAAHAAMRRQTTALEDMQRVEDLRVQLVQALRDAGRPDPKREKAADVQLADAKAVLQRRQQLSDEASATAAPVQRLLERILAYVADHHSGVTAAPTVTVKATGAPATQLHSIRLEIEKLKARAAAVRGAPATDDEVAAAIRAKVAALAARGKPRIGDGTRDLVWPTTQVNTFADGHAAGMTQVPDAMAALAWLNPAAMTTRLVDEALAERKAAGRELGLPRQERATVLAQLAEETLTLERNEEALLCVLAEKGTALPRREDMDPRAVLELDGPPPSQG